MPRWLPALVFALSAAVGLAQPMSGMKEYTCSNCGNKISDVVVKIDLPCPKCGVKFTHIVDENGKKTKTHGAKRDEAIGTAVLAVVGGLVVIVAAAFAVVGGLIWLLTWLLGRGKKPGKKKKRPAR